MARTSRRKTTKKPAKGTSRKSARSVARKPARKAPARMARKGKPAPRGAARAKAAPRRAPRTDEVRQQVARHRPTPPGSKAEAQAEHDHQDPRLAGIPGVSHEGDKVQTENYGQFKNKAVARLDKPQNWFRRGAKPKQ